jgi:hypothetical protein
MTETMYTALLDKAEAKKNDDGEAELPEGRTLTLYVAHDGCSMTVSRIVALRLEQAGVVEARDNKGESYVLGLDDVFAGSISGGKTAEQRTAGFRTP